MKPIVASLLLVLLSGCGNDAANAQPDFAAIGGASCPRSGVCQVSLIAVLAAPEKFDDREIRATGYLVPNGNKTRLYFDKASAEAGIDDRALLVTYDDRYPRTRRIFSGAPRYVSLLGLFRDGASKKGGLHGSFLEGGTITPIFPASAVASSTQAPGSAGY